MNATHFPPVSPSTLDPQPASRSFSWVVVMVLGIVTAVVVSSAKAHAATFTVNSTVDAVDANPGDGVCETGPGKGVCTLRAAIQETNALPGADTIKLPVGVYNLTIPGDAEDATATGDLDISDELTINGAALSQTIVDGAELDRVFDVLAGISGAVTISGMTIRNGKVDTDGGGIRYASDLKVEHAMIRDNQAVTDVNNQDNPAGAGVGGGLANVVETDPTLTLTDVTIHANLTHGNGESNGDGGGLYAASGTVMVIDCTISDNEDFGCFDCGGQGIYLQKGDLTITNSSITGNFIGVWAWHNTTTTITGTTISGHTEDGVIALGPLTMTNSTVSGNGYGIFPGHRSTLRNVTVAFNFVDGIVYSKTITLIHTIVANNGISDCRYIVDGVTLTSLGHNLDSDGSCDLTQPTDLPNTDPKLGPLVWNNGAEIHPLLPGSPAIDSGSSSTLACLVQDQRGFPRPVDGDGDGVARCDIGAVEKCSPIDEDHDGLADACDGVPEPPPEYAICKWGFCDGFFLKFVSVVNPAEEMVIESFELVDGNFFFPPLQGMSLSETAAAIFPLAKPVVIPEVNVGARAAAISPGQGLVLKGANSGTQNPWRLEVWERTGRASAEFVALVAEYDPRDVEFGDLSDGNFLYLKPPGAEGTPMSVEAAWTIDDVLAHESQGADDDFLPEFRRGDANVDGKVDLSDSLRILAFLFIGEATPTCMDAADSNDDTTVDLTDALVLMSHLFLGDAEIPPPGPHTCGVDPTGLLGCADYSLCD